MDLTQRKLTGGTPEILITPSETLLDLSREVDRKRIPWDLSPDDIRSRCSVAGGLGDWAADG